MRRAKKTVKGKEWLRDTPERYERDTPYPRKTGGPLSEDPVFVEIVQPQHPTEPPLEHPQPEPKK
jgi:hypothetical protein